MVRLGLLIISCVFVAQVRGQEIVIDVSKTSSNSPEGAVAAGLESLCPTLQNQTPSDPGQQQLQAVCNALDFASPEQLASAYRALSARTNTSETSAATNGPVGLPSDGIGKRLAALRKAAASTTKPNLAWQDRDELGALDSATGGGASADTTDGKLSGFVTVDSISSRQDENKWVAGFKGDLLGILAGADYRFRDTVFGGLALRYANSDIDIAKIGGSAKAKDWNAILYSTFFASQHWNLDMAAHYGMVKFNLDRNINFAFPGQDINEVSNSSSDGKQYGLRLGSGYEWVIGSGWVTQALADVSFNRFKIDSYTESSSTGFNLNIKEQTIDSLKLNLGAQLNKAFGFTWGVLIPQLNFAWVNEYITDGQKIQASFVSDPTNTQFRYTTNPKPDNFTIGSLGLASVFPGGMTAFINYAKYLDYKYYNQYTVSVGIRMEL